jgi:hypothetical protein
MSDETVRKEFNRGELRSELKIAIPCLRGGDIEWIVALFVSELQASRSAAIQECADLMQESIGAALGKKAGEQARDAVLALKER